MANDEEDSKPELVNPKPDDQKHYENTSEYSKPHTSKAEPEEHVDAIHFGKDGSHEDAKQYDVDHITDKDAVEMGKQTYEHHQSQKE